MSQHYAFFSDDRGFELLVDLDTVREQHPPQEARFALSPDSELAKRPAHPKLSEILQGKARPEKRRYFAQENEVNENLKAERLLSRAQALKTKLFQRKGEQKL